MSHHGFFIVIATAAQLAEIPADRAGWCTEDGYLMLRPELNREQQLKTIAECLEYAEFWAANDPYVVPARPVIPQQRFAPLESLYFGQGARS